MPVTITPSWLGVVCFLGYKIECLGSGPPFFRPRALCLRLSRSVHTTFLCLEALVLALVTSLSVLVALPRTCRIWL